MTIERDEFVLSLRSKTALGRLSAAEVHGVLDYLEGIGFNNQVAEPAPVVVSLAPPPEL